MSNNLFVKNDPGWNRFAATGSVFDYLRYKYHNAPDTGWLEQKVDNEGENCEDRDKRGSS